MAMDIVHNYSQVPHLTEWTGKDVSGRLVTLQVRFPACAKDGNGQPVPGETHIDPEILADIKKRPNMSRLFGDGGVLVVNQRTIRPASAIAMANESCLPQPTLRKRMGPRGEVVIVSRGEAAQMTKGAAA